MHARSQVKSGITKCTFAYEAVKGFWAGLGAKACKPGSRPICRKPGQKCGLGSCPAEVEPVAGVSSPKTSFCRWGVSVGGLATPRWARTCYMTPPHPRPAYRQVLHSSSGWSAAHCSPAHACTTLLRPAG